MFVFIVANLPLPIIFYLNIMVTMKFLRVHQLTRRKRIRKPMQLVLGWWLGNISMIFALVPALWEHRIFVQNHWWLISYAVAAALSIAGLLLMNNGLGEELKALTRRRGRRRQRA